MVDILIPNLQELKCMQLEIVDADSLIDIKDVWVNTDLPVSERFIDFLEQINSLSYKEREEMAKVKAGIAIQEEDVEKYELDSGSMQL